jgi:hypothetical protein
MGHLGLALTEGELPVKQASALAQENPGRFLLLTIKTLIPRVVRNYEQNLCAIYFVKFRSSLLSKHSSIHS